MVDERIRETNRVMAYGAIPAGILVDRRSGLPSGAQRDILGAAVVARRTISGDSDMVEYRRRECARCMATKTVLIRR